MASIIAIKLNLVPGGSPGGILPRVRVSQGDSEDRIIQFELFDGLTPADMSDVDQCYIGGMKPDGNGFTVSCTITSNVATAILTDQATVLAGEIRCKLYLLSATGSVRSASFSLDVDPDPLADAGTSDTDITAIVQAAAMYANNASESADAAAQAATGAATAGATAGQAAAEAVVNNKLDKSTAAEAWASGTEYVAGQYRLYTNGHLYKCILDHTSSSSITPEDTTYWDDTTIGDEISSCNSNYTNLYSALIDRGPVKGNYFYVDGSHTKLIVTISSANSPYLLYARKSNSRVALVVFTAEHSEQLTSDANFSSITHNNTTVTFTTGTYCNGLILSVLGQEISISYS